MICVFKDTINLDNEVKKLPPYPSIVVLKSDSDVIQIFVVAEKEVLTQAKSLMEAVVLLISFLIWSIQKSTVLFSSLFNDFF